MNKTLKDKKKKKEKNYSIYCGKLERKTNIIMYYGNTGKPIYAYECFNPRCGIGKANIAYSSHTHEDNGDSVFRLIMKNLKERLKELLGK